MGGGVLLESSQVSNSLPKAGARVWYDDQREVHRQIFGSDESVDYAFMGEDGEAADNRWLREAWEHRIPIIYFLGMAPGRYEALFPAFVAHWNRRRLMAGIVFGESDRSEAVLPETALERRYALRSVKQRLHQDLFREAVMTAYNGRCAVSGLPERRLLDAAHIISDGSERMGQPVVPNGLPLSKTHHAAFDAHLIGVDPDYRVHVAERLLAQRDGPMLEATPLVVPARLNVDPVQTERIFPDGAVYASTPGTTGHVSHSGVAAPVAHRDQKIDHQPAVSSNTLPQRGALRVKRLVVRRHATVADQQGFRPEYPENWSNRTMSPGPGFGTRAVGPLDSSAFRSGARPSIPKTSVFRPCPAHFDPSSRWARRECR